MAARHPAVSEAIRAAIGEHPDRGALTQLANTVGTTVSAVSRWHAVASSPTPELWPAIEQALRMPAGSLAAADRQAAGLAKVRHPSASPDDQAVLAEVTQLRGEVARLGRQVDRLADVLGVTLGDDEQQHSTDAARRDERGGQPSP